MICLENVGGKSCKHNWKLKIEWKCVSTWSNIRNILEESEYGTIEVEATEEYNIENIIEIFNWIKEQSEEEKIEFLAKKYSNRNLSQMKEISVQNSCFEEASIIRKAWKFKVSKK